MSKSGWKSFNRSLVAKFWWMVLAIFVAWYFDASFFFAIASWFLILIWLQVITKKKYNSKFEIFILIFLILANYMWWASGLDFYDNIPWRDEMLHFLYWMAFTFLWFRIIYSVFSKKNIKQYIGIIIAFSFSFSVAFGAIWEIYEYQMDQWFGEYFEANGITLMQEDAGSWEDAITDTMNDIILETLSALVMCLILFLYMKYWKFKTLWDFEIIVDKKQK